MHGSAFPFWLYAIPLFFVTILGAHLIRRPKRLPEPSLTTTTEPADSEPLLTPFPVIDDSHLVTLRERLRQEIATCGSNPPKRLHLRLLAAEEALGEEDAPASDRQAS